jgi:hypothetical protein
MNPESKTKEVPQSELNQAKEQLAPKTLEKTVEKTPAPGDEQAP